MNRSGVAEESLRAREGTSPPPRADVKVAALAARQFGVVSFADLLACGLSRKEVKTRTRNGHLHRLHAGVYAVGHRAVTVKGRFLAAVKACGPRAVLSHRAAAALHGFVDWQDDWNPEVTIRAATRRRHRGVRVHRSDLLEVRDTTIRDGIRVTTPARTLIDLAAVADYKTLRRAVRQALVLKRVTLAGIATELNRLGPRRGSASLAKILAAGPAPTRSELEDVVLDLVLSAGLERPDVNVPLQVGGRRIIPDFRWPAQRLTLEAEGAKWHDNEIARQDDAERQARLEASGERVLRVTWTQAVASRAETLARIRAAGAPESSERSARARGGT